MEFTLPAKQPFNFRSVIGSHGWYQLSPFAFDDSTGLLTYVLRLDSGRVVELRLRAADGGLSAETDGPLTPAERDQVARAVSWMFGLDLDLSAFYAAVRHEPKLSHAERDGSGRVLRSPTLFEDVLKTILTTNTLWAATKRMNRNLIDQFGEPLPLPLQGRSTGQGGSTRPADASPRAFPAPGRLAAASEAQLREETRLGYRAPYVLELGERVASGELDLEAFKTSALPTLELRKELMKIRGIGPYAAANLLMLLGRPDFIPIDSWALKMVSHEWHNGEPVTPRDVESAFAQWGDWKGMAYWFWDWTYKG
jgi:3-methyladenine DNA glycosylase/8-oxoguanine DNA glycosylase